MVYVCIPYGDFFYFKKLLEQTKDIISVNGKPHTWSKKVPPLQTAIANYSNVFNLQYSGIFSDHGNKSSMFANVR